MNLSEQMEPGPGANGLLAEATLDDLIKEIKTRCNAVVVTMLVEDEHGEDAVVTNYLGGRICCIGMMREAEHRMLTQYEDDDDE